jgi:branched-chain amino acid transport system substrate-binding protein
MSGLALAGGLALGACSAIVEFADCKSDVDCAGAGAGYVCNAEQKCVPGSGEQSTSSPGTTGEPTSTTVTPTGGTTLDETTTTATTEAITSSTTASTGEPGTSTGGPLPCAGHLECVDALGDDHVCSKNGECVSALTTECQTLHWPSGKPQDKVVFLGSIMTTIPPFDGLVLPLQNATLLAVEDFNANTDLPGGYKIAYLACDDGATLAGATAAATHLTDTIGAPAWIGPVFSELVIALAPHAKATGTLMITPTASAKSISTLDDDGLVWRTIASDVYQASALADRLPLLTPAPTKTAILFKDDAYGNSLLMDTAARLMTESPQLKFSTHKYPNPVGLSEDELKNMYGTVIAGAWGAMGMHPDTVVLIGTNEVADLILGFMTAWNAENPKPPLPRFVVSHGVVPALPDLIAKAPTMSLKSTLMMISEGVAPVIFDEANFTNFNLRYKIRFNDQDPITASSLSYDAAMVVMLAMAGVPDDQEITGKTIAASIAELVDETGTPVSFGDVDGVTLTFIKKARNVLVTGGTVDLKGVSGELDFDLVPGEVRTNLIGWGLTPDDVDPSVGVLDPQRIYLLKAAPSTEGTWMDLP